MEVHPLDHARAKMDSGELTEPAYRLFVRGWEWCKDHPETRGVIPRDVVVSLASEIKSEMAREA